MNEYNVGDRLIVKSYDNGHIRYDAPKYSYSRILIIENSSWTKYYYLLSTYDGCQTLNEADAAYWKSYHTDTMKFVSSIERYFASRFQMFNNESIAEVIIKRF